MSPPYLVKQNEHLKQRLTDKKLTLSCFHHTDFTIQMTCRKYILGIAYNMALLFLGKEKKINLALAWR